jgi:uncharacterized protein
MSASFFSPLAARVVLCGLAVTAGTAFAQSPSLDTENRPVPALPQVAITHALKVPLRDGVKLNATRYRGVDEKAAQPCIFTLTPYISQSYHDRGMYFGANGYVFYTVDVRGRGNSEGEFTPLLQEARDGHDVVQWLAKQSECNGKVTMWGGSYAGYNQWTTAKEFPSALATIVPVASPYVGIDFPMSRNIAYPYEVQWLALTAGNAAQEKIFRDEGYWTALYKRLQREGRAFRELDTLAGMPSPIFQQWMAHPMRDAYWDAYNPTAAQYARMDLPILSITGHYDGDQPGALEHYREHMANASAAARDKHFLIIGPWDHAGTRTPMAEVGGLRFGAASVLDMNALHKAWYDWTLKGGPKPAFLLDRVGIYLTGSEQWRWYPDYAAVTAEVRELSLGSHGGYANDVFRAGSLTPEPAGDAKPDRYVYDPRDVERHALYDDTLVQPLTDQRMVFDNGGGSLVYHTAPFAQPVDLAGTFRLDASIALDQRDTDIDASVYEVRRDGSSIFLASDTIRARYRHDLRRETLVEPGKIEKYTFDSFTFIARTLAAGSRLRLVVSPGDSPFLQRNYNSGGVVADETAADAKTVTVTLYHDASHSSTLYVPIAGAGRTN